MATLKPTEIQFGSIIPDEVSFYWNFYFYFLHFLYFLCVLNNVCANDENGLLTMTHFLSRSFIWKTYLGMFPGECNLQTISMIWYKTLLDKDLPWGQTNLRLKQSIVVKYFLKQSFFSHFVSPKCLF